MWETDKQNEKKASEVDEAKSVRKFTVNQRQ